MKTVTYTEVQQLVAKLPESKLVSAYRLLYALTTTDTQSPQTEFMRLSVDERRQLLSQQAEQMKTHYEQTASERTEWQAGDFVSEGWRSAGVNHESDCYGNRCSDRV